MTQPTITKAESLAREILLLSRNTLLIKLRFMDAALCELELNIKAVDSARAHTQMAAIAKLKGNVKMPKVTVAVRATIEAMAA